MMTNIMSASLGREPARLITGGKLRDGRELIRRHDESSEEMKVPAGVHYAIGALSKDTTFHRDPSL